MWKKIELHEGLYSASHIQDYFEYIIKKHEAVADNHPIIISVKKKKNRK